MIMLLRFDEVIGVDQPEPDVHAEDDAARKDLLSEVGALCNSAKYMAAEAAFKACERAG